MSDKGRNERAGRGRMSGREPEREKVQEDVREKGSRALKRE